MKSLLLTLALVVAVMGCNSSQKQQDLDTPSRGTITVVSDESFRPLVEQLTGTYSGIYPDAKFNVVFRPEKEAIAMMLRDSARMVFCTRPLTKNEQAVLDGRKIVGKTERIATDGVALITGKANRDSLITMDELRGLFSGQITDWGQLKGSTQSGPVTLVFDNGNGSNIDFVLRTFKVTDVSKLRLFTAKSNREVIEYVRQNPRALGFIGVNWISDGDEPLTAELSRDLRVLGVSAKANPASRDEYFQPFQRSLGLQDYPLRRPLYIISREAHSGLGGGLINYLARDVGSLIVEKLGLWPTRPYNREVYIQK
ncbi:phosphate ABC transporter substrate-binding protein [Rudanella paleaurantiibacter]|uniref:Phosphate ABC transporter substrate-binding protein n=1 Tax=Rudanella paleaurantiibacter TaxID=2614655 RepID=A0A7J5U4B8_9BACT|nr:substrate-binding domain-containing protein [Rudanella paleaurantiibacter]KAB7731875.1 phosphate ABC transporter substrate-binding protein [Rudanella paleaurantiibacter]